MLGYVAACAGAQDRPPAKLVRAAQLDRIAMHMLPHFYFFGPAAADPALAKFRQCMSSADSAVVVEILARAADASLSKSELRTVRDFYESPLGRKYADANLRQAQAELGYPVMQPAPALSADEKARIAAFSATPGAKKTGIDRLLAVDKTGKHLFDEGLRLSKKCKPQPGA